MSPFRRIANRVHREARLRLRALAHDRDPANHAKATLGECPRCGAPLAYHPRFILASALCGEGGRVEEIERAMRERRWRDVERMNDWNARQDLTQYEAYRCKEGRAIILRKALNPGTQSEPEQTLECQALSEGDAAIVEGLGGDRWRTLARPLDPAIDSARPMEIGPDRAQLALAAAALAAFGAALLAVCWASASYFLWLFLAFIEAMVLSLILDLMPASGYLLSLDCEELRVRRWGRMRRWRWTEIGPVIAVEAKGRNHAMFRAGRRLPQSGAWEEPSGPWTQIRNQTGFSANELADLMNAYREAALDRAAKKDGNDARRGPIAPPF